jgi:hypothetical protein
LNKNKTFNYGKCPNLTFNYSLGKQATKNVEYITSLKEEKNKFKDILPQSSINTWIHLHKRYQEPIVQEKNYSRNHK